MTSILLTIDTELSLAAYQRGVNASDNFANAILGRVADGEWGIAYQANLLRTHGLKAVFFVEALSATVVGLDILKRTIEPVLSAGHAIQLHLHSEWLQWFPQNPVDGTRGQCMADFSYDQQCRLLELGIQNLTRAGAPAPVAFRAGNYGANNDTLRALAAIGMRYDSSYNYPYLNNSCRIVTRKPLLDPAEVEGVIEVPITFFQDYPSHYRPAQICATSASEMRLVIEQSVKQKRQTAVIVGHSFELLNRDRTRANRLLIQRFGRLCELLSAGRLDMKTMDFAEFDSDALTRSSALVAPLHSNVARTALRMTQQAAGTVLYG